MRVSSFPPLAGFRDTAGGLAADGPLGGPKGLPAWETSACGLAADSLPVWGTSAHAEAGDEAACGPVVGTAEAAPPAKGTAAPSNHSAASAIAPYDLMNGTAPVAVMNMTIWDEILQSKRKEVRALVASRRPDDLRAAAAAARPARNFFVALTKQPSRGLNLVAELRRASPWGGQIREDYDPAALRVSARPPAWTPSA